MKRHIQRSALIAGAVIAALLFFLCGAALRLLMGPISLGPFAGAIEDSLNHSVSGVVIRFDRAVLEWSRADGKVNLIVLGTKVFDLDGRIVAQAPKADIDFDAAKLLTGEFAVKRFALIGVQLTGVRTANGEVRLGFGRAQGSSDLLATIRNILKNNAQGGGSMDSFAIRNARLAFQDVPLGLFLVSPDTSFVLQSSGDHFDASLDAAVEISGVPARIAARAVLRENGRLEHGTIDIRGLSLPALSANSSAFAALKPYALTTDLTASFVMAEDATLIATSFTLAGKGEIGIAGRKAPLPIDKFNVSGRYDGPAKRLTLDQLVVEGKHTAGKAKAVLTLDWDGAGFHSATGDFEAQNLVLDLPEHFSLPLALDHLALSASYDVAAKKIVWRRVLFSGSELSANLSGTTVLGGQGSPAFSVKGTVAPLSVQGLLKYWPKDIGTGAREWIADNITAGRLGPFAIEANLPAGALNADRVPNNELTLNFPYEGLTANYFQGLTLITQGRGQATLLGDTFHATMASAIIGPLAVSGGDLMIANLHVPGAPGIINVHAEGNISDVLKLIDEQPLGYAKRFGIDPLSTSGHAAVDLAFTIPMLKDLGIDQVRLGVQAKVTAMAAPIDAHRRLEQGDASFTIDTQSLSSAGTASISGVPFSFKWTEEFSPATAVSTHVDLTGKLDDASRARLALSAPDWLTGPMPVSLALTGHRFHFDDGVLHADLTNAVAELPQFNMEKRAGVPASADLTLHFGDNGALAISDLVMTGEQLEVRGGLSLDSDGNILTAAFSRVHVGADNDFALNVAPGPGGGIALRIDGHSLDASKYFVIAKKPDTSAGGVSEEVEWHEPLVLDAKLEKVVFRDKLAFRNVALAVSFAANQHLTGLTFDGTAPVKGKITGRFAVVKDVRTVDISADEAGDFVRAFTGFPSIRNGTLSAHIVFPADTVLSTITKGLQPDYSGTLVLADFVVADQPFLSRLFSAGSLDGPLRLLQGDGIPIAKFEAPFSARGKLLTIKNGRASGAAIGATFDGTIDRRQDQIDITGSLVPVFGLNSMLGALPVVGDLLVSKPGEGIIGLTYAMKGQLDEPGISVNPLSVLTPGIFRRLFEFVGPKETAQQQSPPPPAAPLPAPKIELAPTPTE